MGNLFLGKSTSVERFPEFIPEEINISLEQFEIYRFYCRLC